MPGIDRLMLTSVEVSSRGRRRQTSQFVKAAKKLLPSFTTSA